MKNRFLVLLITLAIIFSAFNFAYASDVSFVDYGDAELLDHLGIMQIMEETEYSKYITREDFAYSVAMLMGLSADANVRYYTDLRAESFAFGYINNLAAVGVLSPAKDDCFRPLDYITFDEAYKMLVAAMGYQSVATIKGGYPNGYVMTARKLGISCDKTGNVSYADAVFMFYNVLKTVPYELAGVGADGEFYQESDECYANQRFNLNCLEGTVRATHYGNIDENTVLDEKTVNIDGKSYKLNERINEKNLLGSYVEFFCTDEDFKPEIVDIKEIAQKENLVIDISLFAGYSNNSIEYFASEDSYKTKKQTVSGNKIIYNGLPLRSKIRETLAGLNKGTITLKDTDSDGKYDLIDIKDYKNFYIKFVDGTKLYNELAANDFIDLKDAESINVVKDGSNIQESELVAETSISVAATLDETVLDIIVNSTVSGKYSARNDDEIKIDDKLYKIDKSYKKKFFSEAEIGTAFTFWIDFSGNVSYAKTGTGSRMSLAYIIDAGKEKTDAFSERMLISLISADGVRQVLECAENLTIDVVKYRKKNPEEIITILKNGKAHARQLIQYSLDKNGKISEIDTIVKNPGEDPECSLTRVFDEVKTRWYHLGRYGFTAICSTDTLAFCIPNDGSTDVKKYFVGKGAKTITKSDDTTNFALDCYYVSESSPYVDAIVGELNINDYIPRTVFMYDEGSKTLDSDGDTIYKISGYSLGLAQEYTIKEDVIGFENIGAFNRGDLIVMQENQAGEVSVIEKVFDAKTRQPINWEYETDKEILYVDGFKEHYCEELNLSFGYVRKNYGGVISISKTPTADISERIHTNKRLNMLYNSLTDSIELVTDDRIVDYETAKENCMRAVHHMWYEDGRGVFLYN